MASIEPSAEKTRSQGQSGNGVSGKTTQLRASGRAQPTRRARPCVAPSHHSSHPGGRSDLCHSACRTDSPRIGHRVIGRYARHSGQVLALFISSVSGSSRNWIIAVRVTISEYGSSPTGNVESSCLDKELITELHVLAKLPSSCLIEYDCLLISVDRNPGSIFAERHFAVGAETGTEHLFDFSGP